MSLTLAEQEAWCEPEFCQLSEISRKYLCLCSELQEGQLNLNCRAIYTSWTQLSVEGLVVFLGGESVRKFLAV